MTDRKPSELSWDAFVERQIEDAKEAGEFDDLPGFGKPMVDAGEPYDDTRWLKKKMEQERLSVLPPSLEIRRDVERTLAELPHCLTEAAARRLLEELNERIRKANFASVWGPPSTTMPVDVEAQLERWRAERE